MYHFRLLKPLEARSSTLRTRTKGMTIGDAPVLKSCHAGVMPPTL
nr:MAG TPA: hypothetical protein [Caudoviricetes sp.]